MEILLICNCQLVLRLEVVGDTYQLGLYWLGYTTLCWCRWLQFLPQLRIPSDLKNAMTWITPFCLHFYWSSVFLIIRNYLQLGCAIWGRIYMIHHYGYGVSFHYFAIVFLRLGELLHNWVGALWLPFFVPFDCSGYRSQRVMIMVLSTSIA